MAGGYGVFVSTSNNVYVHDNLIHDNALGGVILDWQQGHSFMCVEQSNCLGAANTGGHACGDGNPSDCSGCSSGKASDNSKCCDTDQAMMNNRVVSNRIAMCGQTFSGSLYGPWSLSSRNDLFDQNAYRVPDAGSYWRELDGTQYGDLSWSGWQDAGEDTGPGSSVDTQYVCQ